MACVSRETEEALHAYWSLLQKWNARINLIGAATIGQGWRRHIDDSIQLVDFFPPFDVRHGDIGSGGGLPAIPVQIMRRAAGFKDRLVMIEADGRKATFLRLACRVVDIPAEVVTGRIEAVPPLGAQVLTARALAPLPRLLSLTKRHLCPDGIAILPKGRKARSELASADVAWSFDAEVRSSRTESEALILCISNIDQKM